MSSCASRRSINLTTPNLCVKMAIIFFLNCASLFNTQHTANINDTNCPHRHYASGGWPNPSRESRPSPIDDIEIKKPDISVYDDPFAPEIKFDTGELDKGKILEERPAPTRPPLRLVPRTGRTIHVGRTVDVARSFKLLSIQISQNKVPRDFQLQRFHERPGLKRKRLKSERWQKRFKKGFKACVSRVKELTKQGCYIVHYPATLSCRRAMQSGNADPTAKLPNR
ncbi:hypothetical protein K449DRAFT_424373 [Hypoxylon sp. EC38]|nr:hypothetical protein K449DRAFT_424373 [Hypoxylon sp. EC38]